MEQNFVCEITATYRKLKNYKPKRLTSRDDSLELIRKIFPKNTINHFESFGAIFLDTALNVKGYKILSNGGISGTVIDLRLLFQHALLCNATRLIVFHNHPSGNTEASFQDIEVCKRIKKAAKVLDMQLLDSLILTDDDVNYIKY